MNKDRRLFFRLNLLPEAGLSQDGLGWADADQAQVRDWLTRILAQRVGLPESFSAPGWHRRPGSDYRLLTTGPELAKGNYMSFGPTCKHYYADGSRVQNPKDAGPGYPDWGTDDPIVSLTLDLLYTLMPDRPLREE